MLGYLRSEPFEFIARGGFIELIDRRGGPRSGLDRGCALGDAALRCALLGHAGLRSMSRAKYP